MGIALGKLAAEDPSFRVETDAETGQTLISGMGELHLDIIVDRMKREFGVDCNVGKPQVAYRETIRGKTEVEGKFVRQSGVVVNMVTYGSNLNPLSQIMEGFLSSLTNRGGVIPGNLSTQLRKVSKNK